MENRGKKSAPAGDRRGRDGGRESNEFLAPYSIQYTTDQGKSQDLSRLLDHAIARTERCAALAEYYGRQAEKHGRIKAELERLVIPLDEPVILEPGQSLADWAERVAEEVWSDD